MSIEEIPQNPEEDENKISLSTEQNSNEIINRPSETDFLNDPESALESQYNTKEEKILRVNEKSNNNNKAISKPYLFYGNHFENLHPKYIGRTRALFYYNNYPLIIIGPDCKFIIIIL